MATIISLSVSTLLCKVTLSLLPSRGESVSPSLESRLVSWLVLANRMQQKLHRASSTCRPQEACSHSHFLFIYYGVKWKVLGDMLPSGSPSFHSLLPCLTIFSAQQHKPEHVLSLLKALQELPTSLSVKGKGLTITHKVLHDLQCNPTSWLLWVHPPPLHASPYLLQPQKARPPCYSVNMPGTRSCLRTFVLSISSAWNFLPPDIHDSFPPGFYMSTSQWAFP